MEHITGIILAGGKSRRMGVNKALLEINGEKNIERLKNELLKSINNIIVIANTPSDYEFLNVPIFPDILKEKGPLAGIHSGLKASSTEWNLFIACDLPFFTSNITDFYVKLLKNDSRAINADAIIPYIDGQRNPLVALYNKRIVPVLEKNLMNDKLVIATSLDELNVIEVTENDFMDFGMSKAEIEDAFYNMNRPEDYEYVKRKLALSE